MLKKLLIKMKWLDTNNKLRRREMTIDLIAIGLLIAVAYALYVTKT